MAHTAAVRSVEQYKNSDTIPDVIEFSQNEGHISTSYRSSKFQIISVNT
jgi:hypothetical protein